MKNKNSLTIFDVRRKKKKRFTWIDREAAFYSRHPEQDRSRVVFREVPETS